MELTQGAQLHVATLSTLVERCKEARAGVATWLGAEEREEAREARIAAAKLRSPAASPRWTKKRRRRRRAGRACAHRARVAATPATRRRTCSTRSSPDSDEEEDEAATAAAASKAAESETVAGEVLAREVVRLEASVEEVLKRALGGGSSGERGVKDTANLWRLFGDFREARGERLAAAEARLKRLRALDTSGWRKDPAAFAEYVDASLGDVSWTRQGGGGWRGGGGGSGGGERHDDAGALAGEDAPSRRRQGGRSGAVPRGRTRGGVRGAEEVRGGGGGGGGAGGVRVDAVGGGGVSKRNTSLSAKSVVSVFR